MFKNLVSNLPFNPGLIHQVSFYARRLNREQSLRRASMFFMAATLVVNILALATPAQNTLATSLNDIIYGAKSKNDVLSAYQKNRDNASPPREDIKAIYNYYGITEQDIVNAQPTTLNNSSETFISTGRWLSPGDDYPQSIPGTSTTIYERDLAVWARKGWKAIQGRATGIGRLTGRDFWILLEGCGNIVYRQNEDKFPSLEVKKTRISSDKLRVGENVTFRIDYRNNGQTGAEYASIEEILEPDFTYIGSSLAPYSKEGQKIVWFIGRLEVSSEFHQITITAQVNRIPDPTKNVCNAVTLRSANASDARSNSACVLIDNTCPGTNLPVPDNDLSKCVITCPDGSKLPYTRSFNDCPKPPDQPKPRVICESFVSIATPNWDQRTVRLSTRLIDGAEIRKVEYLINDKVVGSKNQPTTSEEYTFTGLPRGDITLTVRYDVAKGTLESGQSCIIKEKIEQPFVQISALKKVRNITQNISDATTKPVVAGDILEYTLSTTNSGTGIAKDYIIKPDSLGRVLEYADLKDYPGASFDRTSQQLSWNPVEIKPNQAVQNTFTVQVKSPIPATAPSRSDPAGRQFTLCNTYGNEVCVPVSRPTPAVIQNTVEQLPNTGPGSSIVLTFIAVVLISFFYMRSKILYDEVEIIKREQTGSI